MPIWLKVSEGLPKEGILCVVYFPMGHNRLNDDTYGPIAMAYHREEEGWIYADEPTPLRFKPYYWQEFCREEMKQCKL
jgi:hypothetical protein